MRAVFEGLAFAARDCYAAMGAIAEGGPPHRRRGAQPGAARDPWRALGAECAASAARGGRRRRRRDDRGGAIGSLSRHDGLRRRMGDAASRRAASCPTLASRQRYDRMFPGLSGGTRRPAARSGAARAHRARRRPMRVTPSRSSAIASCCPRCFATAIAAACGDGARHPVARTAMARRADGAWLCRAAAWTG